MSKRSPEVVKISSPGDLVLAVSQMLGFTPTDSIVTLCTHGRRRRFGLTLRFDLEVGCVPDQLAAVLETRVRHQKADGVFVVIFGDGPVLDGVLPYREVADEVAARMGDLMLDVLLVADQRWWSYLCQDAGCCGPGGTPIDDQSSGATAIAAAYAFAGQVVLPDREALVASVAFDSDPGGARAAVEAALARQSRQGEPARVLAVRTLVERLIRAGSDPRTAVTDGDAAELAAFCHDVIVRDEVLVQAIEPEPREVLLRVLRDAVRRVPPPYDAPICATLAWVAYATGDGALANVALDRVFATDPDYSLGLLIFDSLNAQVPPTMLEQVMREAGRDLRRRSAAG
ncbi:MAG TPA: DUF4192 domain-containing protein [Mycobacteriales bacterium]|jgi:hypothetical protein|nr:DUF4192 domain-containing protein [Mycobacteriales bacterium]